MMTRRMVMDYKDNQSIDLADEIYSIKDTNITLKKQLNDERERSKILMTKIQKLSEDVKRNKEMMRSNKGLSARELAVKRDIETEDLIKDLRKQVQKLTKENSKLNSKVITLETIQDAQKKKRMKQNSYKYSIMNPNMRYSNTKRLVPTPLISSKKRTKDIEKDYLSYADETETETGSVISESTIEQEIPQKEYAKEYVTVSTEIGEKDFPDEEKEKLQTLANTYRSKIEKLELELEREKNDKARVIEEHESELLKEDIDRISMQKDISDKTKKILEYKRKNEELSGKYESINEAFEEAKNEIEKINNNYKEERKKRVEAEEKIKNLKMNEKSCSELETIIADLRAEKENLSKDIDNLVSDTLNGSEVLNKKHEEEIKKYIKNEEELNYKIKKAMEEKAGLLKQIDKLTRNLKDSQTDLSITNSSKLEMQQKYEELKEKIDSILKDGVEWKDIEEALTFVNLRKKKGISEDNLLNIENSLENKKLLQDLQIQYADCVRDLDKYQKLLEMEEKINNEFKLENEDLKKKIEQIKNEYEMRLEEDSRILDLRSNKIAYLEAQLKNIIYGTTKVPQKVKEEKEITQNVELENGQNLIEFNIKCANINSDGISILSDLGFNDNNESMTTCISYDFYEFESQSTPLGLGVNPRFNSISKYKVFVDDFFLYHIQNKTMVLDMYRTNGVEYVSFATCNVSFKDLLDPSLTSENDQLKYYNDLISTTDNKTVVGNIEYTIRATIPMNQAIKTYKDRSLALNLLSNTSSSSVEPPVSANTRQQYNELTIEIIECYDIISKDNEKYKNPFVAYKFYIYDEVITETVWDNLSPKFNNVNKIMLAMSPSLDRYLRTSTLSIAVFNDDKSEENYIFGVANVNLSELANNNSIHGLFDIIDDDENKVGQILVNLEWDKDYSVEPIPLISKYDEYIAKSENPQKSKKGLENKKHNSMKKGKGKESDSSSETDSISSSSSSSKLRSRNSKSGSKSSLKSSGSSVSSNSFSNSSSSSSSRSSSKSNVDTRSISSSSSRSSFKSKKSNDLPSSSNINQPLSKSSSSSTVNSKSSKKSNSRSITENIDNNTNTIQNEKENSNINLVSSKSSLIKKEPSNGLVKSELSKKSLNDNDDVEAVDDDDNASNGQLMIIKTNDENDETDKSSVLSITSSKSSSSSKSSKSNRSRKSNKSSKSSKSSSSKKSNKSHHSVKSDKSDKSSKSSKSNKSIKSVKSDDEKSIEKQSSKEKLKSSNSSISSKKSKSSNEDNNENVETSSIKNSNSKLSQSSKLEENISISDQHEVENEKQKVPDSSNANNDGNINHENREEESKLDIIPIKLNQENNNNVNTDDNVNTDEIKPSPLERITEEDENEESDIMSYGSDDDDDEEKSKKTNTEEVKSQTSMKKSNSEITIPKATIIKNEDEVKTSTHEVPEQSETEDNIEESIEEEYLTDDFEDDNETENKTETTAIENKEVTNTSEQEDTSVKSNQNKDLMEITIESIQFKLDPEVQDLLKDVKECFIAYEFLNYEPQDLTSNYSMLTNNQMIFHFSKVFNIHESQEKINLFKDMLKENDFQISIFRPPDATGISNELAFAEWDWNDIIVSGNDVQNKEIVLYDPNQTIEMGTMSISFKGINFIKDLK